MSFFRKDQKGELAQGLLASATQFNQHQQAIHQADKAKAAAKKFVEDRSWAALKEDLRLLNPLEIISHSITKANILQVETKINIYEQKIIEAETFLAHIDKYKFLCLGVTGSRLLGTTPESTIAAHRSHLTVWKKHLKESQAQIDDEAEEKREQESCCFCLFGSKRTNSEPPKAGLYDSQRSLISRRPSD